MNYLHFNSLDSTYNYVAEHAATMASGTVVSADFQSAGRGQRGNTWEAEAGCNLLFTLLERIPAWPARSQFFISEAVSLAIADTLHEQCGVECRIKWPNDIYAADRKIAGILISHSVDAPQGDAPATLGHTVIGAGININQEKFRSDAPNPVSVRQLTGRTHELEPLLRAVCEAIAARLQAMQRPGGTEALHAEYMTHLWRGDGQQHPFYDVATGERFRAAIRAVEPSGHLILVTEDGPLRRYAFKEVSWL